MTASIEGSYVVTPQVPAQGASRHATGHFAPPDGDPLRADRNVYTRAVADTGQPRFYVTAPLLWPMLLGLRTLGVDTDSLLQRVGLSLEALQEPDTRVSAERALQLVRLAIEDSGDDSLGLRLSQLYEPGAFGVLDHLAHSARTLGEAVSLLCRYERIHQNGMRTALSIEGDRAVVSHRMLHPYPVPRQLSDNTLANLIVIGRKLTGIDYPPLEVGFAHPAPANTYKHEKLFRCRLRWNAPLDVLVIPAALLDAPLRKPNPGLINVLEGYARELLGKLSVDGSFQDRVREHVYARLPSGATSLPEAATALGISSRTLQRRLNAEGTSHAALLDDLRRKLAEDYLLRAGLGTEDVALMLGFSDSRAFRRAFKRWTGVSPIAFRHNHKA